MSNLIASWESSANAKQITFFLGVAAVMVAWSFHLSSMAD